MLGRLNDVDFSGSIFVTMENCGFWRTGILLRPRLEDEGRSRGIDVFMRGKLVVGVALCNYITIILVVNIIPKLKGNQPKASEDNERKLSSGRSSMGRSSPGRRS